MSDKPKDVKDLPCDEAALTHYQLACLDKLVTRSGLPWLDKIIRESLRDIFAGQALAGFTEPEDAYMVEPGRATAMKKIATSAYALADAMLEARE